MHPLLLQLTDSPLAQLAPLGIGGVLAGVMFWFYRQDRKASERKIAEYRTATDQRYEEIAKDFRAIVQQNTEAAIHLADVIERILDRDRR